MVLPGQDVSSEGKSATSNPLSLSVALFKALMVGPSGAVSPDSLGFHGEDE